MASPQRASGSLRNKRQIQRAIDQGRDLSMATQKDTAAMQATIASQAKAIETLQARLDALEVSDELQDLLIEGGLP